jgi:hypothetical protein
MQNIIAVFTLRLLILSLVVKFLVDLSLFWSCDGKIVFVVSLVAFCFFDKRSTFVLCHDA